MSNKIVTYPRGFQGFNIGIPIQTKGDSISDTLVKANYGRQGEELRFVISNTNVEALWKQINLGLLFTSSEEVREKILTNALIAFGTESFHEWFVLQETNPSLTDLHRRFLNDTINFILTGKRSVSLPNWQFLIVKRPLQGNDAAPALKIQEFFGTTQPLERRPTGQLKKVIPQWVSQPGGFDDLIGTLHILFGDTE